MQPALSRLSFRARTIWRDVVLSLQIEPQKMTISPRLLAAAVVVLLLAISTTTLGLALCARPAVGFAGVAPMNRVSGSTGHAFKPGSQFFFAAAGVTRVPDEGSTLLLLGAGILGLFAVGSRLRK